MSVVASRINMAAIRCVLAHPVSFHVKHAWLGKSRHISLVDLDLLGVSWYGGRGPLHQGLPIGLRWRCTCTSLHDLAHLPAKAPASAFAPLHKQHSTHCPLKQYLCRASGADCLVSNMHIACVPNMHAIGSKAGLHAWPRARAILEGCKQTASTPQTCTSCSWITMEGAQGERGERGVNLLQA